MKFLPAMVITFILITILFSPSSSADDIEDSHTVELNMMFTPADGTPIAYRYNQPIQLNYIPSGTSFSNQYYTEEPEDMLFQQFLNGQIDSFGLKTSELNSDAYYYTYSINWIDQSKHQDCIFFSQAMDSIFLPQGLYHISSVGAKASPLSFQPVMGDGPSINDLTEEPHELHVTEDTSFCVVCYSSFENPGKVTLKFDSEIPVQKEGIEGKTISCSPSTSYPIFVGTGKTIDISADYDGTLCTVYLVKKISYYYDEGDEAEIYVHLTPGKLFTVENHGPSCEYHIIASSQNSGAHPVSLYTHGNESSGSASIVYLPLLIITVLLILGMVWLGYGKKIERRFKNRE